MEGAKFTAACKEVVRIRAFFAVIGQSDVADLYKLEALRNVEIEPLLAFT